MANDIRPIVSDLDFTSIKEDILDYFRSRDEFKDYDFTGSGLNLLIDILAYNTHYNALSANFLVNESYLDSAILRSNVVSLAKTLNYTPRSASASFATVTIRLTKTDINDINPIIIPGGTLFQSSSGNSTYNFRTMEDYSVQFKATDPIGTTIDLDVVIYEGTFRSQRFLSERNETDFSRFEIPQSDIDTSLLKINVNGVMYNQIIPELENIFEAGSDEKIFFVEESRDGYPVVVFGNDVVGKSIDTNDEIVISYLQTSGPAANNIKNFTVTVPNRTDAQIVTAGTTSGGAVQETIQEIKDFAPKWFQSQYRAVTVNDYEAIIRKKFSDIQDISVYGGEDLYTPGRVYITIKPKSADTLPDSTKLLLKNEIIKESTIVTVTPVFVDPSVIKVILNTTVTYDESKLTTSSSVLTSKIQNLFEYFNNHYISDFLSTFRESNFSYEIRNLDTAVVGSNTRIKLKKELTVENFVLDTNRIEFKNKLYHPEAGFRASEGGILSTNLFKRRGQNIYSAMDEDGNGKIRLYDVIDGNKVYISYDAGVIDYDAGTIEVVFDLQPTDSTVEFTVIPDSFDVTAFQNIILEIDVEDSIVNIVEKDDYDILKNLNLSRSF